VFSTGEMSFACAGAEAKSGLDSRFRCCAPREVRSNPEK
jgi:hypothetical protein